MLENRGIRCEDGLMKKKLVAALGAVAIALSLSACDTGAQPAGEPIGGDVIAPVTQNLADLDSTTVELKVGQVLNINTGDVPVEAFEAEVADPAVVEFAPGRTEASAEFNPGFTGTATGTTEVTVSSTLSSVQVAPATFTITVK